jgi:hypothetical protein
MTIAMAQESNNLYATSKGQRWMIFGHHMDEFFPCNPWMIILEGGGKKRPFSHVLVKWKNIKK